MELGALICKPNNPRCNQCQFQKNESFEIRILISKNIKKNISKYFILKVFKKQKYLLIKNTKFNF